MAPQMNASLLKAWLYIPPVILVVGTVGNVLTLLTTTSRYCNKSSFTTYLTALAFTDTVSMYVWLIDQWWLHAFGIDIYSTNIVLCKTTMFAWILFGYTSSWLVVALTVERTFCTYAQHLVRSVCRPRTGYIVIGIIVIIALALGSHTIYGFDLIEYEKYNATLCGFVNLQYEYFMSYYFTWIDFMVYSLLPSITIVFANSVTVIKVIRISRTPAVRTASDANRKKRIRYMKKYQNFYLKTFNFWW